MTEYPVGVYSESEDYYKGGMNVGMISGDTRNEPPGLTPTRAFTWKGSRVTLWTGRLDPSAYPAGFPVGTWHVDARWVTNGHPYTLGVFATPNLGPAGTIPQGEALLLQVLQSQVRYANP
ncbi:MAG TPA: hypothetical protein VMK12_24100 [Anaeromyxobacteraceae bacterium]|nr:hypothetical protein [Anaeromyxobacteraceae bacterium]